MSHARCHLTLLLPSRLDSPWLTLEHVQACLNFWKKRIPLVRGIDDWSVVGSESGQLDTDPEDIDTDINSLGRVCDVPEVLFAQAEKKTSFDVVLLLRVTCLRIPPVFLEQAVEKVKTKQHDLVTSSWVSQQWSEQDRYRTSRIVDSPVLAFAAYAKGGNPHRHGTVPCQRGQLFDLADEHDFEMADDLGFLS